MPRFHPISLDEPIFGDKTTPWDIPDDHEERLQRARLALLPKRLRSAVKHALAHLSPAACLGSWALGEADSKRLAAECLDEAIAIAQELRGLASEPEGETE